MADVCIYIYIYINTKGKECRLPAGNMFLPSSSSSSRDSSRIYISWRCYCQIVLFFPFSIQLLLLLPPPHMMPALPLLTRENLQVCRPFFLFPCYSTTFFRPSGMQHTCVHLFSSSSSSSRSASASFFFFFHVRFSSSAALYTKLVCVCDSGVVCVMPDFHLFFLPSERARQPCLIKRR